MSEGSRARTLDARQARDANHKWLETDIAKSYRVAHRFQRCQIAVHCHLEILAQVSCQMGSQTGSRVLRWFRGRGIATFAKITRRHRWFVEPARCGRGSPATQRPPESPAALSASCAALVAARRCQASVPGTTGRRDTPRIGETSVCTPSLPAPSSPGSSRPVHGERANLAPWFPVPATARERANRRAQPPSAQARAPHFRPARPAVRHKRCSAPRRPCNVRCPEGPALLRTLAGNGRRAG